MGKRSLDDIFNNDPLGLLNVEIKYKSKSLTDSYLLNGFNDIQEFFERTGRAPQLNESQAIEELRLAKRLDTFRVDIHLSAKLAAYDKFKLLDSTRHDNAANEEPPKSIDDIMDSDLLKMGADNIFDMKHTHINEKKQSVNDYTASRKRCQDFEHFRSTFEQVQSELESNKLDTRPIEKISEIQAGQWFIVQGMLAYVAEMTEKYEHRKGHHNARLRVIFSNKTESDLLLRSFGAALYKDGSARQISTEGKLSYSNIDERKEPVGIVYVLKTLSQQDGIKEHREYLHKIGVTGGSVEARVLNAENDPTYLLAPVEIVGEFQIYHMNIKATEKLLHKFFQSARADVKIKDRFGKCVRPREWFFVTVKAIQDAVRALQEDKILNVRYDHKSGKIVDK